MTTNKKFYSLSTKQWLLPNPIKWFGLMAAKLNSKR